MIAPNNRGFAALIKAAKKARKSSYCPYSHYPVGASVLAQSGKIYAGSNVENASYGLSLCAERVAIFNAISRGEKRLKAICVVGRSAKPCGACRQVMLEFSSSATALLLVDADGPSRNGRVAGNLVVETLPDPFDPVDSGLLKKGKKLRRK